MPKSQTPRRHVEAATDSEKRDKHKKRSPLRQVTAKKPKLPKDVPVGPKQIRFLRGLGHALDPVVQVGKAGVTDEVVAQTKLQLGVHELIKVKLAEEDRVVRAELATHLASACGAVLAQQLGRTVLLYKRHPKTPKIALPRNAAAAPADEG
jgi:RNA-binding protein